MQSRTRCTRSAWRADLSACIPDSFFQRKRNQKNKKPREGLCGATCEAEEARGVIAFHMNQKYAFEWVPLRKSSCEIVYRASLTDSQEVWHTSQIVRSRPRRRRPRGGHQGREASASGRACSRPLSAFRPSAIERSIVPSQPSDQLPTVPKNGRCPRRCPAE